MFKVCTLASGSSGNCTYVEAGKSRFLIDCGISAKQVSERLEKIGKSAEKLDGVFITHEHTDHIRGIDVLSRKYDIPVFVRKKTYDEMCFSLKNVQFLNSHLRLGNVIVDVFEKSHDAADPVSFVVNYNGKKLGVITDLGYACDNVKERIKELDCAVLESNHDVEMLRNGRYPWFLKKRIESDIGHLSNNSAADLVVNNAGCNLKNIFLAHLSINNNEPELALKTFGDIVRLRKDLKKMKVYMAPRHDVSELVSIR